MRVEYEDHLLGALLAEPALLDREDITGELFTAAPARAVYKTMRGLREAGHPVSLLTVADSMNGQLAEVGGSAYLASLSGVSPANAEFYVQRLQEAARARALLRVSRQLVNDLEEGKESGAIIEAVEKELLGIRSLDARAAEVDPGEVLRGILATAEKRMRDGGPAGVTTGFPSIDRLLGGLQRGSVYLIAARTSQGKTALATSWADEQLYRGIHVDFASLEMSADQVYRRLLSSRANVPAHKLQYGTLTQDDYSAMVDACTPLQAAPLRLLDNSDLTVSGLRAWARQNVAKGTQVIYLDYVGLLRLDDREAPRWEKMSEVSRTIKGLARELSIPFVALVQMNRGAAEDGKAGLHNLRDTGALEQDADVVLSVSIEEPQEDEDVVPGHVEILKNRNGPRGRIPLAFRRSTVRFREAVR